MKETSGPHGGSPVDKGSLGQGGGYKPALLSKQLSSVINSVDKPWAVEVGIYAIYGLWVNSASILHKKTYNKIKTGANS